MNFSFFKGAWFKIFTLLSVKSVLELLTLALVYLFVSEKITESSVELSAAFFMGTALILISAVWTDWTNRYCLRLAAQTSARYAEESTGAFLYNAFRDGADDGADRQISRVCFEAHRLNQNIFTPSIQAVSNLFTFLFVAIGIIWFGGFGVAWALLVLALPAIFIRSAITPRLSAVAKNQKVAHRQLLARYRNLVMRARTTAMGSQTDKQIMCAHASLNDHNAAFVESQTLSLRVKLILESYVFVAVVTSLFLASMYSVSAGELFDIIYITALASLRLLPAGIQIARALVVIQSDQPLLTEFLNSLVRRESQYAIENSGRRGVSFVMGPSGSGKTTLIRQMATEYKDQHASIFLEADTEIDISHDGLTVASLLKTVPINFHLSAEVVNRGLDLVTLNVSRGQYQRILLAAELSAYTDHPPRHIFLDEALNGCESSVEVDMVRQLRLYAVQNDVTLTVISHNSHVKDVFQASELISL